MKIRLSFIVISLLLPIIMFAQNDVTTFLGIPVDGYKSEMRKKIISKGFTPKQLDGTEYFEGEFNGTDVQVFIATNNNKVYRIMLCDANTLNETDIKIRFNKLVHQFEKNKRYMSLADDQTIPDSEDISYGMLVNNIVYEAAFYQKPDYEKMDTVALLNQARQEFLNQYSEEELANPTDEIQEEIFKAAFSIGIDLIVKKTVWFRIQEHYGKYYIAMFYDNEYNHVDGEDL